MLQENIYRNIYAKHTMQTVNKNQTKLYVD